ncbi:MAG: glycosyltransferase [Rubripirellula sp.]|nr:glycosyltransferase [Rubripirellula sp.]
MTTILTCIALTIALIPALLTLANLPLYCLKAKQQQDSGDCTRTAPKTRGVSILIPARDEASGIETCIEHALKAEVENLEVIVLDDHSTDETAAIVNRIADTHKNVRLIAGKSLPKNWNGKQYACHQLAENASSEHLLFIDADVRLQPDGINQLLAHLEQRNLDLLSAFPKQEMKTWLECWILPLMHLILLGYLPIKRMRMSRDPAYAAGCGQLFLAKRSAYQSTGGHQAIRDSRHDGLMLPRLFRSANLATDIIDGTEIATCRMYHCAAEVLRGVLKNAHEGIARPKLIALFTILLLGKTLLPTITLLLGIIEKNHLVTTLSVATLAIAHLPRCITARRFKQSFAAIPFHVPAVILFITLQWIALTCHSLGYSFAWRGRT